MPARRPVQPQHSRARRQREHERSITGRMDSHMAYVVKVALQATLKGTSRALSASTLWVLVEALQSAVMQRGVRED